MPWHVNARQPNVTYYNDRVELVAGVGKVLKAKVNQAGVISAHEKLNSAYTPSNKSTKAWSNIRSKDASALPFKLQHPIDYRKHPNPYQSLRSDDWKSKITTMPTLSNFCCTKEIFFRARDESKDFSEGSAHESNWHFHHDALSFMGSCVAKD